MVIFFYVWRSFKNQQIVNTYYCLEHVYAVRAKLLPI